MRTPLLRSSTLILCLGAGCASAPATRVPGDGPARRTLRSSRQAASLPSVTHAGVRLGAMPVALRQVVPRALSMHLLIENQSAPELAIDPADFALGPIHGGTCGPATVEPNEPAATAGRSPALRYAQAGPARLLGVPARDAAPDPAALADLELTPGTLAAPERAAGILTFTCVDQEDPRPLLLRWRLRSARTGAALGEIEVPIP